MTPNFIQRLLPVSLLSIILIPQLAWSAGASSVSTAPMLHKTGCTLSTIAGDYIWDESARTSFSAGGYTTDEGWVYAVSVGREHNDGKGHITAGQLITNTSFQNPTNDQITVLPYYGTVTVNPDCTGTYHITEVIRDSSGVITEQDGGGGPIYIDPKSGNFTLLDAHNLGSAKFVKDHY